MPSGLSPGDSRTYQVDGLHQLSQDLSQYIHPPQCTVWRPLHVLCALSGSSLNCTFRSHGEGGNQKQRVEKEKRLSSKQVVSSPGQGRAQKQAKPCLARRQTAAMSRDGPPPGSFQDLWEQGQEATPALKPPQG